MAAIDKRVKVIVPQAPPSTDLFFIDLGKPDLGIPVMVQAAHADRTLQWDDNTAPTWAAMKKPRWLLDITQGGHFTFLDTSAGFDLASLSDSIKLDIPGANVKSALNDGCAPPALERRGGPAADEPLRGGALQRHAAKSLLVRAAHPGEGRRARARMSVVTADP